MTNTELASWLMKYSPHTPLVVQIDGHKMPVTGHTTYQIPEFHIALLVDNTLKVCLLTKREEHLLYQREDDK